MSFTLKLRRDTSQNWLAQNPILAAGEPGFERNTGKFKIGDGQSSWTELDYFVPNDPTAATTSLPEHILSEDPHPNYDDGRDFFVIYENAKV